MTSLAGLGRDQGPLRMGVLRPDRSPSRCSTIQALTPKPSIGPDSMPKNAVASEMAAMAKSSVAAMAANPGGRSTTVSPWDIQTVEVLARPNQRWDSRVRVSSAGPYSRNLEAGGLFVPLKGEQDGHQYVAKAFENGAKATLWAKDHPYDPADGYPRLVVDDPLEALQQLGKYYLNKINPVVVAVTGSNGKTTTKDMVASILATQMNVIKTYANFNNDIGVPVTLLNMEANTEAEFIMMMTTI